MKSLAARALAAGTVAAGALMISVPAAGAATHGKGGSGQQGSGQGATQSGKSHGQNGTGNGKGEGQGESATQKAPSSTGGHKGGQHGSAGSTHKATSKAGKKAAGSSGQGSKQGEGQKGQGGNSSKGGQAPAGNNGTIKLDQSPLTSGAGANHANHPHLSCQLALSFFGFDAGTDYATVQFSTQPPSGKFTPVPASSGETQFSFSVAKRTGGGELDTSQPYTLDVSGLKASHQGYHIKVVTHVTYSQGSEVKQKVFWYEPCAAAPSSSQQPSSSGSPSSGKPTKTGRSQPATSSSQHASSSGSPSSGQPSKTGKSHQSSQTELRSSEVTKTKTSTSYGYGLGAGSQGTSSQHEATRLESSRSSKSYGVSGSKLGTGRGGTELASSNSGQLPNGAGTDLGWFSPEKGSLAPELDLIGGLGLLGGGSLVLRRMRKRRA